MAHSKASPMKVKAAERRIEVLKLRIAGLTYQQIADKLGISYNRARTLVVEEYGRLTDERNELAMHALATDLFRLEQLLAAHWPAASGKDADGNPVPLDKDATAIALRLIDRQIRLLGIDAPIKTESKFTLDRQSTAELVEEARRLGVPVPEGLEDSDDERSAESDSDSSNE